MSVTGHTRYFWLYRPCDSMYPAANPTPRWSPSTSHDIRTTSEATATAMHTWAASTLGPIYTRPRSLPLRL